MRIVEDKKEIGRVKRKNIKLNLYLFFELVSGD